MTKPIDKTRSKLLRKAYKLPFLQTTVSRSSSITNAFVAQLLPVFRPTDEEIEMALDILEIDPADVRCAYCGDRATERDHLNPFVMNRQPSGYVTEIANLVPSCSKCNQSKGNTDWHEWMHSQAENSPTGRKLTDVAARVKRLRKYEAWRAPTKVDFEAIVGPQEWKEYWQLCNDVIAELRRCKTIADDIRAKVVEALKERDNTAIQSPTAPTDE